MAVDERRRKALCDAVERRLGEDSATMTELPRVGWADLATKEDLRQLELRLEAKLDALRAELRGETARVPGFRDEKSSHTFAMIAAITISSIFGAVVLSFIAVGLA